MNGLEALSIIIRLSNPISSKKLLELRELLKDSKRIGTKYYTKGSKSYVKRN